MITMADSLKGLSFVFFLSLFLYPALLHAQFGLPGAENTISITVTPQYPAPSSSVHLKAESNLLDLSRALITWSSNGKTIASGDGTTETDVTVGALGQQTSITITAAIDSTRASGAAVVIPTQIDLLYESNSYTPPFYRGRALPSAGTMLRLQAIPRFTKGDGSLVPAASIIYIWKRNGELIQAASGLGRSAALLPGPTLFATDTIVVEAHTSDNTYSGSASLRIPSVEPVIALYLDSALFGILYHQALSVRTFVPNTEMTFVAVPYFAQAYSPDDQNLQYEWHVNSQKISADATRPSAITLSAGSSDGTAIVELSLTHAANYLMSSNSTWNISLKSGFDQASGSNGSATNNPFEQGF